MNDFFQSWSRGKFYWQGCAFFHSKIAEYSNWITKNRVMILNKPTHSWQPMNFHCYYMQYVSANKKLNNNNLVNKWELKVTNVTQCLMRLCKSGPKLRKVYENIGPQPNAMLCKKILKANCLLKTCSVIRYQDSSSLSWPPNTPRQFKITSLEPELVRNFL